MFYASTAMHLIPRNSIQGKCIYISENFLITHTFNGQFIKDEK